MKQEKTIEVIAAILIILFLYTGGQKVFEHDVFRIQISRQPLPDWMIGMLEWSLPPMELLVAGLLVFTKTRRAGLFLSAALLFAFTGYTALAFTEAFGYIPCACGRIFSSMGWGAHLLVNIILSIMTMAAIFLTRSKAINSAETS